MSRREPNAQQPKRPVRADLVESFVLEVYGAVRLEGRLADRALDHVLRRERRLYSAERRAIAEGVWGLLRSERRIDFALFGRSSPALRGTALHRARWAAFAVAGGQDPAQVAGSMRLPPSLASRLSRVREPLPPELGAVERVALEGSLPDLIAEQIVHERGEADALELVQAFSRRAPLTVRANGLKIDRQMLRERLRAENVSSRFTSLSPWGLGLETRVNAFGLQAFQEGLFEVQDEGSQLLAMLVQARPGERVVDACAGAGGKTLALSAEMGNKGEIVALDVDAGRLAELARRARRAGAHNIRTRALPRGAGANAALQSLHGKADRVLVDAPCSGLGALRRNPDARYRLTPEDFIRYPALQREILESCAPLLRPGGRLVYATCSIARAEDEAVVESFLAQHPELDLIPASGIVAPAVCEGPFLRTFPHRHNADGFFAAVLQRKALR